MKIGFISDTHNKHHKLIYPKLDMIVCCGDITSRGSLKDLNNFIKFYSQLPIKHKILIAGNHDFCFENESKMIAQKMVTDSGIVYLNDSGINIAGINIWGSPIQPWFHDWAFNRYRGDDIKKHWDLIPENTDLLITHGPPFSILDKCYHGELVGCEELLKKVQMIKPKIHAFGHIHEEYGLLTQDQITYINASSVDMKYKNVNPPIVVDWIF